jgi:hypothetical protein
LEEEYDRIVAWILTRQEAGDVDANTFSIAVTHTRHAIDRRRECLAERPALWRSAREDGG